ncbi:hypothetical protein FZ942_14995 [Azospirillum lipoferum]|uniref:Uncharacterized protein n=1 Tax=Azospirillum lipoferum TaxID=193 RepID=A0A5A9GPN9_AZOLI|nr:hypothetical protein FZ942_14995 [Azospirillum lipoferum]
MPFPGIAILAYRGGCPCNGIGPLCDLIDCRLQNQTMTVALPTERMTACTACRKAGPSGSWAYKPERWRSPPWRTGQGTSPAATATRSDRRFEVQGYVSRLSSGSRMSPSAGLSHMGGVRRKSPSALAGEGLLKW